MEPDEVEDPDDYEYGFAAADQEPFGAPGFAAAAAGLGAAAFGGQAAAGSGGEGGEDGGAERQQRRRRHPRDAMSRGARLLLLMGPALHRLASRLSTAVLATGRVTLQLGGDALRGASRSAVHTTQKAQQGFATRWAGGQRQCSAASAALCSCGCTAAPRISFSLLAHLCVRCRPAACSPAGQKLQAWRRRMEAVQQELPDVRALEGGGLCLAGSRAPRRRADWRLERAPPCCPARRAALLRLHTTVPALLPAS